MIMNAAPCDVFINHRDRNTSLIASLRAELCLLMETSEKVRAADECASSKWCFDPLATMMDYKKPEKIVIPVFHEIAQPLVAQGPHEQIIYRDLKACNILLENQLPTLSDFGFATLDFRGDTESMALEYHAGGFTSNDKDEVTSKLINNANKETSQKSENPEMGFKMKASICQSQSPTKGNNHDDDSNPFGLSGPVMRSQHKRKENVGKFCSSLATLTFPLFMFLIILGHPLKETQGSLVPILVSSLAMFDLIAFIFAVSVMFLVRWQFSWLQFATMLISAMAIRVAHSNLVISVFVMLMEAPIFAILYLLWNAKPELTTGSTLKETYIAVEVTDVPCQYIS